MLDVPAPFWYPPHLGVVTLGFPVGTSFTGEIGCGREEGGVCDRGAAGRAVATPGDLPRVLSLAE